MADASDTARRQDGGQRNTPRVLVMTVVYRLARLYWRLMRPLTVGVRVIVTNEQGEVLLLRHTYKSGFYLPGGKVKRGESLRDAVVRELREEVGVRDVEKAKMALVGAYSSFSSFKSDHILVVSAQTRDAARPTSRLEVESVIFADPYQLPDQTSPATRRRIEEYLKNEVTIDVW